MAKFAEALQSFHQKHERLKKYVHTAWRFPLPPWGQTVMGILYFSIPVIGGYQVMQWAISKSHESIGERGAYFDQIQLFIKYRKNRSYFLRLYLL